MKFPGSFSVAPSRIPSGKVTTQQWKQIKDLVTAAQSVDPRERESYVLAQCGDDEEIRREVLSLLQSHDAAGDFLEIPAVLLNKGAADEPTTQTGPGRVGSMVGAYQLVREIGHGGMGTVYLASRADNEFRMQVAIKLIRRGMESDFAIRRFRNERQILARLEHPNIARLIDGGTTTSGHPYFVMEFVEGAAILSHCQSQNLDAAERVRIFLKVCSALNYAHRRMIIHRDIKPSNILVMEDGTPKLLDFGIAKMIDPEAQPGSSEITLTGFRMITPAYASPEQVRGESATVCSDIYSLGIVLWEIVTGIRIDPQSTFELPDYLAGERDRRLLENLRNVVVKATRARPEERYSTVEALATDLEQALAGRDISAWMESRAVPTEPPQRGSIAVLPFQLWGDESTSEMYLGVGISDAVITRLSNVGRIPVRPTGSVMKFAAGVNACEAGRELNVQFVLEGRVRKIENQVRVTVQLVDVETKGPIWASSFYDRFDDLLQLEDSISAQVAEALIPQLSGNERKSLAQRGTTSAKAHEAYLRGRWYWNKHTEDSMPQALVLFTEAIAEDPQYARAHAGIADYYIALGARGILPPVESFAAAIQSAKTALELDPELGEAHASLGFALWAQDRDYEMASHHLQLAIALNPDYALAHDWLGLLNSARSRSPMAIACIERARKLDPSSSLYAADLALCHYLGRRYERALECLSLPPRAPSVEEGETETFESPAVINAAALPLSLLAMGQTSRALNAARRFAEATGRSALSLGILARAEAAQGDTSRAQAVLDELNARARDYYVSGIALAMANLACGRRKDAITQLERACRERDWWSLWLPLMPVWDELRPDRRFERLLADQASADFARSPAASGEVSRSARVDRNRRWWIGAAAVAVVGAFLYLEFRGSSAPFRSVSFSKLTTNGLAERAAISADGEYVAYTIRMNGEASVWIRKIGDGSSYQIAGPFGGMVSSLQFTRKGAQVAFLVQPVNDPRGGSLYIVPASGGTSRIALAGVSLPVGVSPDASQFAYYRSNPSAGADELVIARPDGAGARHERVLYSRRRPEVFLNTAAPAWSPDGKRIACAVNAPGDSGSGIRMDIIDLNGSVRTLDSVHWQSIVEFAWMKDERGLLVAGKDRASAFQQVWYVPLGRGRATRVTNDLSNYQSVGLTLNEGALVAVQAQTVTNLYVLGSGDFDHPAQITAGQGRYFDVAWTPDGGVVYGSDSTGSAEIWSTDVTGNRQQQLTNGAGQNYAPAVAPDGRSIAFHSNRGGVWNIWKMNLDGSSPSAVTQDASDSKFPRFTADGASLVYEHRDSGPLESIWRVPLSGGKATRLTTAHTMYPAMAADGRMAAWYCANPAVPQWAIAIYQPGASTPERVFGFPSDRMPNVLLRWVPGKNAVSYVENRDGVSNIWMLPIDTGVPRQLTSFTSPGRIYSFDWSQDRRLVYSQGPTTSDVVLMRDLKKTASASR
jgi:eukaryotic-like serine/threonine-protein kinase